MFLCLCVYLCLWRLLTPLFGGFENFGSVLLLLGKIKDFCRLRAEDTRTQKQMGFANKQTIPQPLPRRRRPEALAWTACKLF